MADLKQLQEMLEWHCNDTNNHHCKIVTELKEDSFGEYLKIWLEHNEKGETVKESGLDNVLRDCYTFEKDNDAYVSTVSFSEGHIVLRE